ncbi:hypothetical protein C2845_PM17G08090 [Panicum miliaceum]|uniref:Uncharacterized protein n=1 Tax=Panicum miliaceum TaxID=4540 RepID=A0A3L6PZ51_PANMI|nr:hypothetical protein C2845_PM17G08090 [Panicum miliaceum]
MEPSPMISWTWSWRTTNPTAYTVYKKIQDLFGELHGLQQVSTLKMLLRSGAAPIPDAHASAGRRLDHGIKLAGRVHLEVVR